LWETWTAPDGELVESFTILTADANDVLRPIHDRMPVIIASQDYDRWLAKTTPPEDVQAMLHQYPAEGMESFPVSTPVNNPRNDVPQCLEPMPTTDAANGAAKGAPRALFPLPDSGD